MQEYPEVLSSGLEPLAHYLKIGRNNGCKPLGELYQTWCRRFDILNDEDRALIRDDIASNSLPSLCVLVYIDGTTEMLFDQMIGGIERQLFSDWRALLVISANCALSTIEKAQRTAHANPQFNVISVRYTSSDISRAADNPCVVFMSGGVFVREHAFYMFSRAAASIPSVGLVYSDEDGIDDDGNRRDPIFKPGYSPALADQVNYFGRCFLVRDPDHAPFEIAKELSDGTFTIEQCVESILKRVRSAVIIHISSVLYHDVTPPRARAGKPIQLIGPEEAFPTFTIIIPTRNLVEFLKPCIESIEVRSDYPRTKVEIIIVDNGSTDEETVKYLATLSAEGRAIIIDDAGQFNYSRLNNRAAAVAKHDVLLFMNNDMIVDDPLWLRRIATFVLRKDVAAVGGKLLYPDRRIQHGGIILGIQAVAGHNLVGLDENHPRAHAR